MLMPNHSKGRVDAGSLGALETKTQLVLHSTATFACN